MGYNKCSGWFARVDEEKKKNQGHRRRLLVALSVFL